MVAVALKWPFCGSEDARSYGTSNGKKRYACNNPACSHKYMVLWESVLNTIILEHCREKGDERPLDRERGRAHKQAKIGVAEKKDKEKACFLVDFF
ncbi:MAG: hypothetical protein LBU28_05720 [Spirochaetaceae bacterium]|nr:hypothetical protein [Spirochaetaceae bacterium]